MEVAQWKRLISYNTNRGLGFVLRPVRRLELRTFLPPSIDVIIQFFSYKGVEERIRVCVPVPIARL
jgi:hypothetical protein